MLSGKNYTLRSGGFLVVNSAERYHTDCMHRCSRLPFSSMTEESFNLPVWGFHCLLCCVSAFWWEALQMRHRPWKMLRDWDEFWSGYTKFQKRTIRHCVAQPDGKRVGIQGMNGLYIEANSVSSWCSITIAIMIICTATAIAVWLPRAMPAGWSAIRPLSVRARHLAAG